MSADQPAAGARGLACRIGAVVDERRASVFQALRTDELMNRLSEGAMPFDWTVNPYRGCEIGCAYCYARPTHEYLGHTDPAEFEQRIYVKEADPGRLQRALRRARDAGQEIAIGTATDPYQPAEGRFAVTRSVLEAMARVPGLRVGLTTKSAGVLRDLPQLKAIAARSALTVNVSLISLDADLLRRLEPRAPRPDLRLDAMGALAHAGLRVRLFVMPILPVLTDGEPGLRALLAAGREAGAGDVAWQVLFLRGSPRGVLFDALRRERPDALPRYEALYRGSTGAPAAYRRQIDERMRRLVAEVGLGGAPRGEPERAAGPRQLTLAW
jgi:DNA repair photolyase